MQSITEKVNNRKLINVTLHEDAIVLQNVVVTALGIKREEKALGYAVQKVEAEELTKVKGVNLVTSLSGKIAGVLVKNSTNFGSSPEFLVRGATPLLVVDGVPKKYMSMGDIPADDVEDCGTFTFDISKVSEIKKYCENIHIWHSTDDTMCRYANTEYLLEQIPESILHKFENRSHFLDTTFWELFEEMKK